MVDWKGHLLFFIFIVFVNLPFGYLRKGYPKFSRPWARCLYIPVTINILSRRLMGLTYKALPFVALGVVTGQCIGARIRTKGPKMEDRSIRREGIRWTEEALRRVEKAPEFVRPGIYRLMEKRARERGVDLITSEFLTEIRNESMMLAARRMKALGIKTFSMEAFERVMERMSDEGRKEVIRGIVAFLKGRGERIDPIITRFKEYLEVVHPRSIPWEKEALDLPGIEERKDLKGAIEKEARDMGYRVITRAFLKEWLDKIETTTPVWTEGARRRLERIPILPIRKRVEKAIFDYASSKGYSTIDEKVVTDAIEAMDLRREPPS